jgi:hypothetical protein
MPGACKIFIDVRAYASVSERRSLMTPVDIGGRHVPALLVRDMSETLAFYQTLGFTLTGLLPESDRADVGRSQSSFGHISVSYRPAARHAA